VTRKGKIARLPQPIREQINRRLENGEKGKQIAQWLNTLPEVTAVMASEFGGQPVNEPNLSHWKLGGYRDWEAQQEALEAARLFNSDAAELGRETCPQLADKLALCLTARLAVALRRSPSGDEDPDRQFERLRRIRAELTALRKGDHNAQWLRIESGKLDLHWKKYRDATADRRREIEDTKNPQARAMTKEAWEELERDLKLL
jgi:hypothetical protein